MPVLTPPRALPGLLMSIARFVHDRGAVPEADLFELTVPQPLRRSDGEGAAELTFDNTIEVGKRIGLLDVVRKKVTVPNGALDGGTHVAWEQFLLERVLAPAIAGDDPFAEAAGASADLAKTLCWFLDLDPTAAPVFTGPNKQNAPQTRLDMLVSDGDLVKRLSVADAAWNSFSRWAVYLGLARTVNVGRAVGILPDAYPAIRRIAADVVGKRPEPIGAGLKKIGDRIPVLGEGRIARRWHELHAMDAERDLPPALSFALFRLHDEGLVKLSHVGDADVVWRFRFGRDAAQGFDGPVAPQVATFSHIGRGAAA